MEKNEVLVKALIQELNAASEAYYGGQEELMTNYEWDQKFDQLKEIEKSTGIIYPDSPTQSVGTEDEIKGKKEEHEFSALSLAKTKKISELVKWAGNKPINLSWKLDGLTLVVTYDDSKLSKVVTRGDGHIGTNVTHLASGIKGIPTKINIPGHVVIRGESLISYTDFNQYLSDTGAVYSNPRNLASGSYNLDDLEEFKKRNIQFIPFTLVYIDQNINSWNDRMNLLRNEGFTPVESELFEASLETITKKVDSFTKKVESNQMDLPVDGLVICYDDTEYAATGSVTGHHATRAGYAFKWQDESKDSNLVKIEWSCGTTCITPVAIFEPIELEGTTVRRASLCNLSECKRLSIGEGSKVSVIKANKIIPKVIKSTSGKLIIPDKCPACGAKTFVDISVDSKVEILRCSNPLCTAKQLKKFTRFVSKDGMDIDGLSIETLRELISEGWIKEFADIYKLDKHINEMMGLEGFGEKKVNNLLSAIEKSKNVKAKNFLYALSVPMLGHDAIKKLLGNVKSYKDVINSSSDFTDIDGIGPRKNQSIKNWFAEANNLLLVDNLEKILTIEDVNISAGGNKCNGLTFVITGDVHHYKNRDELKAYIESQGGKVSGSVSGKTSYLINNDVTSTSGKNKKANDLGISIISEDEFISKYVK